MLVEIRDLAPGETLRVPFDERVTVHSDGTAVDAAARGDLRLDRAAQGVRLRGSVEARLPLVCSRCLSGYTDTLRAVLDEEFFLGAGPAPHGGELGPEDFVTWIDPDQHLDVTEVVRQHLQMAVPMAPLCRPDCRGLCPACGANWNEQRCEHERSERGGS